MPDPYLHGNGEPCPACALRREESRRRSVLGLGETFCNHCNGTGRIAWSERKVYEHQLADARRFYWTPKANPIGG